MMKLKGSQTEKNLLIAFAGESQARNRYTYFASQAKKEGYEQIAAIFEETANQEREHAKREFKFLEGGEVEITAAYPAGAIGSTLENLKAAAGGEHYENTIMYPEFAKTAEKEGFPVVANVFKNIAIAEPVRWVCRNCGYVYEGTEPPDSCPACAHPKAHFELEAVNY
jgi:rubrerythrin